MKSATSRIAILVSIALLMVGCKLPKEVQAAREQAPQVIAQVESTIDQQQQVITELESQGHDVTEHLAALSKYREKVGELKAWLTRLDALYDSEGNLLPDVAAREAMSMLPPQYAVPIGLLIGFVGQWLRSKQERARAAALPELIKALNVAKASDEALSTALNKNTGVIHAELSTAAKSIINELRA